MDRRSSRVAIASLCVALAVAGAPAGAAQAPVPEQRFEVSDVPPLSELPPLPTRGDTTPVEDEEETSSSDRSGVQTTALVLAIGALVAGGLGLALVTRRGRGEEPVTEQAR